MGQVFKTARRVVVWLGTTRNRRLQHIGRRSEITLRNHGVQLGDRISYDEYQSRSPFLLIEDDFRLEPCQNLGCLICSHHRSKMSTAAAKAVVALAGMTYWRRLWIIQELALAKQTTFLISDQVISGSDLKDLFELLQSSALYTSKVQLEKMISPKVIHVDNLLWWHKRSAEGLWSALHDIYFKDSRIRCSNPRDLIYGLLGMVASVPATMRVDYSLPTEEVFGDLLNLLILEPTYLASSLFGRYHILKDLTLRNLCVPIARLAAILGVPARWKTALNIDHKSDLRGRGSPKKKRGSIGFQRTAGWVPSLYQSA